MATREHWEVDPWNAEAIEKVVTGGPVSVEETDRQLNWIFDDQSGMRCLEIGAGYGRLLPHALNHFSMAYGVDSSVSLVARSTIFLRSYLGARVVLNDGLYLPFPDNYFDFVYSFTCFQHMTSTAMMFENLKQAQRVLKRNGSIRIQTVRGNPAQAGRYDGVVFRDAEEFRKFLEVAGFEKVNVLGDGEWLWATAKKQ